MPKKIIYVEDAIKALEALFVKQIKQFGYDSYEKADEKTQLVCDGISESIGCLLDLPSAQPERKTGRWIDVTKTGGDFVWKCSECGELNLEDTYYCPNCGSYNGGGENDGE